MRRPSQKPMMRTYVVIPKAGDAVQVRAEQLAMSPVHHIIRLFNGSRSQGETVALFHCESIVGVIEEASNVVCRRVHDVFAPRRLQL